MLLFVLIEPGRCFPRGMADPVGSGGIVHAALLRGAGLFGL
jgi:hypothetical protein